MHGNSQLYSEIPLQYLTYMQAYDYMHHGCGPMHLIMVGVSGLECHSHPEYAWWGLVVLGNPITMSEPCVTL